MSTASADWTASCLCATVESGNGGDIDRLQACLPHEFFDAVEVGGAGSLPGQTLEGGIGLDGGGVDTGSIGGGQLRLGNDGQDALEDSPVDLHGQSMQPDAEAGEWSGVDS